jgi:hypothetical protein
MQAVPRILASVVINVVGQLILEHVKITGSCRVQNVSSFDVC